MRIALITRNFPPYSWCGVGRFYASLCESLQQKGQDIEVFCQGYRPDESTQECGYKVHRILPRKHVFGEPMGGDLGGNKSVDTYTLALATGMLEAFRERHRQQPFDLVEGHDHLGINALINIRFSCLATVTRCHMSYHSLVSRGLVNWSDSPMIRDLEGWGHRRATYRIAPSRFMKEIAEEDFGGPCVDEVVPHGLSPWWGQGYLPEMKKERLVVFVGRMMPELKKPEWVAKAFRNLAATYPDWRLEFAGLDVRINAHQTSWGRCRELLGHLESRVLHHGHLDSESLRQLFRKARILVVPSSIEAFGLVALEAMAAGCVPLVADRTALPEIVGAAGAVFANGSIESLQTQLERLMANDDCWTAYARLTGAQVARFQSADISELNLAAYRRALALHARTSKQAIRGI